MRDRELMQRALDALDSDNPDIQLRAAIALRDRLAQPEPEPVAWIWEKELAHMSAVASQGMTEWKVNLGLKPQAGDVGLYLAPVHAIDMSQERVDETGKDRHD
jgi:hypothetical protein